MISHVLTFDGVEVIRNPARFAALPILDDDPILPWPLPVASQTMQEATDVVLRRMNLPLRLTPPLTRTLTPATWSSVVQSIASLARFL